MFSGNESRAVFRYIFLEKQEDAIGPIYVWASDRVLFSWFHQSSAHQ
jgi:hypothetical protein